MILYFKDYPELHAYFSEETTFVGLAVGVTSKGEPGAWIILEPDEEPPTYWPVSEIREVEEFLIEHFPEVFL